MVKSWWIIVSLTAMVAGAAMQSSRTVAGELPQPGAKGELPPGDVLRIPGRPAIPLPPGTRLFPRPPHAGGAMLPTTRPPAKGQSPARAGDNLPPSQKRVLDELFARLARATDASEAEGIARAIKRIWLRSGSDTADLLMTRAGTAMGSKNPGLAEKLLDRIVALEPDWAEAWNRRATVRYEKYDDYGAMADIAQVLVREPRHFGALSGMGYILERHDMHGAALRVFRKVLALYPRQDDIRKMVDKLTVEVEGRDI